MAMREQFEDAALTILADGVKCGCWSDSELSEVLAVAARATPDLEADRIHVYAFLLFTLVVKGLMPADSAWPVALAWLSALRERIGCALLTVVELVWEIAAISSEGKEAVVRETLTLFPPDVFDEAVLMCEQLLRIAGIAKLRREIAAGIARMLCLPRMIHRRMSIADQTVAQLADLLRALIEAEESAAALLAEAAGPSAVRAARLQRFLS